MMPRADGKPVAKNDVHEPKSKSTGQNHGDAAAKERLVTVKEEGAVNQFLGVNGDERVEEHDQGPEAGSTLKEGEQELGRKKAHREPQEGEKDSITHEQRQELGANVVPRSEMREIKAGVAAKSQESGKSSKEQIGDGEVGQKPVVNQKRDANEERRELQREQNKAKHG